jgi:hypothetical protein
MDTGKEQFEQFKCLGAMVNIDSSVEEEIKERITAGNRAYHVLKKVFTSKLISRNVKLRYFRFMVPCISDNNNK